MGTRGQEGRESYQEPRIKPQSCVCHCQFFSLYITVWIQSFHGGFVPEGLHFSIRASDLNVFHFGCYSNGIHNNIILLKTGYKQTGAWQFVQSYLEESFRAATTAVTLSESQGRRELVRTLTVPQKQWQGPHGLLVMVNSTLGLILVEHILESNYFVNHCILGKNS